MASRTSSLAFLRRSLLSFAASLPSLQSTRPRKSHRFRSADARHGTVGSNVAGMYGAKPSSPLHSGLSREYVPLPWAVLPLAAGSRKPVTGCRPALKAMSCCLMPPFPAAAGGGPGHASCILLEVRLSAKQSHVSHQWTVPDVTNACVLPPSSFLRPSTAATLVNALALEPSNLEVASFNQEVDLPLQVVHNQQ